MKVPDKEQAAAPISDPRPAVTRPPLRTASRVHPTERQVLTLPAARVQKTRSRAGQAERDGGLELELPRSRSCGAGAALEPELRNVGAAPKLRLAGLGQGTAPERAGGPAARGMPGLRVRVSANQPAPHVRQDFSRAADHLFGTGAINFRSHQNSSSARAPFAPARGPPRRSASPLR
eukprot:COSAG04_NODE_1844_length_5419_cov_3.288722_3_plen_176_part_01